MPIRYDTPQIAKKYIESGLAIVPIKKDGSKSPPMKWQGDIVYSWFNLKRFFNSPYCPYGIGILCGERSGNLEVIDFDLYANTNINIWLNIVMPLVKNINEKFVIAKTPSGGYHLYYRCSEIDGNTKLSNCYYPDRPPTERWKVFIETRGIGGLVVAPGSPGYVHNTGKEYVVKHGSLYDIPTITPDERKIFLKAATFVNDAGDKSPPKTPKQFRHFKKKVIEEIPCGFNYDFYGDIWNSIGLRPGDQANQEFTWEDILKPHGWNIEAIRGDTIDWRRPDKPNGISATTGYCGDHLYVFSSNAYPFESETAYDKFAAITLLDFSGDFSESAKFLYNHFKKETLNVNIL